MLNSINEFTKLVQNQKCGCIYAIVKCDNLFNKLDINQTDYCSINMNVIIIDRKTKQAIIGEIQFTVEWMLNARKVKFF